MREEDIESERERLNNLSSRKLLKELREINPSEAFFSRILMLTEVCERYLEDRIYEDDRVNYQVAVFRKSKKIRHLEARIRELEKELVWWKDKALSFKRYGGS